MGFIAISHGCSKAAQEVEKDARRSSSNSRHGIAEDTSQQGEETDSVFLNTFEHVSDLEPNFPFARSHRLGLNEPQS